MQQKPELSGLNEQIKEPLAKFVEKLNAELSEEIVSLTVVGSSLTKDYRPGKSDINSVLVVKEHSLGILDKLAGMGKAMGKRKIAAPILMTTDYISRSSDVFAIEFLDFQFLHKTILGDDPFAELDISKNDLRLQAERELKSALINLRQGYIRSNNDKKNISQMLSSAVTAMIPLVRGLLWFKVAERKPDADDVFKLAGENLEVDTQIFSEIWGWRRERPSLSVPELANRYSMLYETIDKLTAYTDKLEA